MGTKSKAPVGTTVKVSELDVPPPVVTVTLTAPAVAIRLAGTEAVSWLGLTYVVANAVLPQSAVAPETKFAPFTVSVNPALPAVMLLGISEIGDPEYVMV